MITWPFDFPNPSVDYNINVNTSVVRTKMDSGRYRQRRRFTRDLRQLGVNWELSDYEYGIFQSIYYHTLNSGADWFYITLPLGDDLKQYTARFVADSYSAKYDGVMYWKVSAKLETEDESSPYDAETAGALTLTGIDVTEFELAVAELTEVTSL